MLPDVAATRNWHRTTCCARGDAVSLVVDNGQTAGLITPAEVRQVPRDDWNVTSVRAAMKPHSGGQPRHAGNDGHRNHCPRRLNQLPVVSNGHLEGIVTRAHVLEILQARSELQP